MDIGLLRIMNTKVWDFRPDMAQGYADALKNAIELHVSGADLEKKRGYYLSMKGYQKDGNTVAAAFQDKLYVGNIYRVENHLYYNDEELADDDQIINVVVVDGPVTRDGDGCSYGTKDFRDQVMYANTIPQVVGHLFIINTPGGQAVCRNDYEAMIDHCRQYGKPTVAFVDGMCCSSGMNLAARCDRMIVMNPKDEVGCIGTMAAFWAVAHDTVSQDGYRYVELVGSQCPEKNAWYREAAKGEYEKLQAELDKDTEEFHKTIRENRPLVTDDMLSGKVFEAQELIPALVDEIGTYERALQAVFDLADGTLPAARTVVEEPKGGEEAPKGDEPEELAKLNAQQKAAISNGRKGLMMAEDGHVTTEAPGFFGPETQEVATPKNDSNMTDEEKKAQEAQEAQAAQEQAQQQEAAGEGAGGHAGEQQEEAPAGEQAGEGAGKQQEEAPAGEGTEEGAGAGEQQQEEAPAGEQQQEGAPGSQEALENAQQDIDKMQETLHNAEQMVAERDKTITDMQAVIDEKSKALDEKDIDFNDQMEKKGKEIENLNSQISDLNSQISEKDNAIAEKDAKIEKLQKQVSDLKAEVEEMAGKPAPMTDDNAGVPASNGTGEAPKEKKRITRDMSYEQIRAFRKNEREAAQASK